MKKRVRNGVAFLLACLILLVCVLEGAILAGSRSDWDQKADAVLILGAMVYDSGPSEILQLRMETGLLWLRDHPNGIAVVCGGQGSNEPVSEAKTMADFLIGSGVPPDRVLLEDRSDNTYENLRNSAKLLTEHGYNLSETRVIVVSNGFHLARVRLLARRCGLNAGTLMAPMPDDPSYTLYCYVREGAALLKSVLLDRGSEGRAVCPVFAPDLR